MPHLPPGLWGSPKDLLSNDYGGGPDSGRLWGTVIGAAVGIVVAVAFPPASGVTPYLIGLGAETGTVPPLAPRQIPGPPGLARLVNPLLGVPFQLGSRSPEAGTLDCWGLVSYLLRTGRGLVLPEDAQGRLVFPNPLTPVWVQTGKNPSWRLTRVQPWDVLVWYDYAGQTADLVREAQQNGQGEGSG
jgi:hypothetical protein